MRRACLGVLLLTLCDIGVSQTTATPAPPRTTAGAAQTWTALGAATAVRTLPNGVEVQAGSARLRVEAVTDSIIRVRIIPRGNFSNEESWAVVPEMQKASVKVTAQDTAQAVEFRTREGVVRVFKRPLRVAFYDAQGKLLSQDAPGRSVLFSGGAFRTFKEMPLDEHYYGLGDKGAGFDHRERAYTMWNTDAYGWEEATDPLYKTVPFFLALRDGRAYGVFLDNTWRSYFDFGKQDRDVYSFGAEGGELNYFFIFGPHPKQVIERYTALIGRTPLPALYALGFQQCRYSYYPEARVREVARTFREKRIPADVIYLDIHYQDKNKPFTIDRQRFPTFEDMVKDLHAMNWRVIAITDLHIAHQPGYMPYDTGMAGDHFVKRPDGKVYVAPVWPGPSVFPDFTLSRTREWWGNLYKEFVGMGLDGFWNDMNEPAVFLTPTKTMPLDNVHRLDNGRKATHSEIHNIFGMQNVRATYEGMLRLRPNLRPFVLTRAAYAGAQRWAATWTGDNTSSWNHYRLTVPTLLNMGISGYPFVGVDIGGFRGSPTPDLLTRWHQLGAFNPIYRNHTQEGTLDQEPWVHGPEHEAIRKRYIELRYILLPYTYTAMEETTRTGLPLMRPLFLEYPHAPVEILTNDRQFFYGRDLMIAANLWEYRPTGYEVNLPKGDWYDYWTGKRVPGGKNIEQKAGLEELPIFVRAGAIIPHQPVVQHTAEVPNGPLELRVYPGPDCRGSLYLDDGTTFDYRKGEFLRLNFTCEAARDGVRIWMAAPEGKFAPWWKQIQLRVYGAQRPASRVSVGGQAITDAVHDPATGSVSVTLPATAAAHEVQIQY